MYDTRTIKKRRKKVKKVAKITKKKFYLAFKLPVMEDLHKLVVGYQFLDFQYVYSTLKETQSY